MQVWARLQALVWVVDKEVRETVRDPHVLLFLLFPIAVYPLMLWVALQIGAVDTGWRERQHWRIDVDGPERFEQTLLEGNVEGVGGVDGLARGSVDLVARVEVTGEPGADVAGHAPPVEHAPAVAALAQARQRLDDLRDTRVCSSGSTPAGCRSRRFEPLLIQAELEGGALLAVPVAHGAHRGRAAPPR
ncbi:MAG: hypothetical protein R3F59_00380 [Myxococcota bacterium]